jgi:hypothetical protein
LGLSLSEFNVGKVNGEYGIENGTEFNLTVIVVYNNFFEALKKGYMFSYFCRNGFGKFSGK